MKVVIIIVSSTVRLGVVRISEITKDLQQDYVDEADEENNPNQDD